MRHDDTAIILSSDRHHAHILVDADKAATLSAFKWLITKPRNQTGIVYAYTKINGKNKHMHRLVAPHIHKIDHANGNGIDNRLCNLRPCNAHSNAANAIKLPHKQFKGKPTSSKFKGVHWHKNGGTWLAHIGVNGKLLYLGTFRDELAAALAYNAAALKHFGEFANINHIASNPFA